MVSTNETRTTGARSPEPPSLDETEADDAAPRSEPAAGQPLARGRSLGRYVILARLGRGGMGVVYAAYDPELDRKIALKVLHDTRDDAAGRRRSQRLLREAQAMAQLSHPNVITVHDVGTFEDRVFFTMELVEGQTLSAWLRSRPRAWPEIVETFVAAGRGLQAAHEAGLVHRDFKPDNVLVGVDGRVRVTDFGIARPPRASTSTSEAPSLASPAMQQPLASVSSGRVLDMTLTRPGALAGTPAYMSPEQFGVGALDARGDQFSFCVALWEALYGEAPFGGATPAERALAVSTGALRSPPPGVRVPAFVHAAITRGLAVEPAARHPSMAVLLAALSRRPDRRRRGWLAAGGVAAVVGAVAAAVALRPDPCESAGAAMADTWGDEARGAVEAAMLGSGLPFAPDTWSRVRTRLDAHADAWVAERAEVCRAARDGGTTDAQLARRERCLERQRAQLGALVEVLGRSDRNTVERATAAVVGLPRPDECADPRTLLDVSAEAEPPELVALRERYLHLAALDGAGHYQEALPLVETLVAEVQAQGDPWLVAQTMALHGTLVARFDPKRGEEVLRRGYFEAVRRHQDAAAARLAATLVFVVGYVLARTDAGLEWAAHADAAIDRAGGDRRTRIKLLKYMGDVHTRHGEHAAAKGRYEEAQALVYELGAQGDAGERANHEALFVLTAAAAVKLELGEPEQAQRDLERALVLSEELFGPQHPETGRVHNELGNVAMRQERFDDARRHYQTALELWTVAEGERAPTRVPVLTNLGNVADLQGRFEEARGYYEQALAVAERLFGRDHVDVAFVLVNLGILHEHAGEPERAKERFARALALREKSLGAEHPMLVNPLLGLARAELRLHDPAAARAHAERALALRQAGGGEEGPAVAEVLATLGRALVRQGAVEEGRARLERVLAICEGSDACESSWTGRAAMELGLGLGPEQAERRRRLLERARVDLERAGTEGARDLADLRQALAG